MGNVGHGIAEHTRIHDMAAWIVAAGLAVMMSGVALAQVVVEQGQAKAAIVVAADAPDSVQLAARELQDHLQQATGAQLPIQHEPAATPTVNIFVGDSAPLAALGFSSEGLGTDAFRIVNGDGFLAIFGSDYGGPPISGFRNPWSYHEVYNPQLKIGAFGETGTLYGVYRFLEDHCGVRWYMPGELGTVVPKAQTISVPAIDLRGAPDFEYRYPWFCNFAESEEDARWYRRAGFGAPYPAQIIHSFNLFVSKYKDTHPEYFAIIDGERDFTNLSTAHWGGNLCLSNPDVAEAWIAYINEYFDKNPAQGIFPLSPNDGMVRICDCEKCQAQIVPDMGRRGKFSNYVWGFIDTVAKGIAKTHPDKFIGGIAYEAYSSPPTCVEKLSPNVAVMLCKARGGFADPDYREGVEADLAGWRAKADKLYCWEYYREAVPPWRGFPVAYPRIIAEDVPRLKNAIAGEFIEAESWVKGDLPNRINFPGLQHLNLYLTVKLYWDAERDADALLAEYFDVFYGPAAESMKAFWTKAEDAWMSQGGISTSIGIVRAPATIFPAPVIEELDRHLERAKAQAPAGSDYRARVDLIGKEFDTARTMMTHPRIVKAPELTVPRCRGNVEINGRLDDPAWEGAATTDFVAKDATPAPYPTTVRAMHDRRYLYLAFVNQETAMNKLNAGATERDQSFAPGMWDDDSIEIFLAPDPAVPAKCYQFIVNAKGLVWDAARGFGEGASVDKAWNASVVAAAAIEAARWTLEVRIPLEEVGTAEGGTASGNFFRNRYCGGPAVYSGWSPTINTGHFTPRRFGTIVFSKSE